MHGELSLPGGVGLGSKWGKRPATFVALSLALTFLVAACGPQTATLRLTVHDPAGKALAGVDVAVEGKTAKTDASGVATLSGLEPGQAQIGVSGQGYQETRTETLKAGANQVTITLTALSLTIKSPDGVPRLRMRFTFKSGGKTVISEGAIVRDQASHWKISDDAEFVTTIGGTIYLKVDGRWQKLEGLAGAFAGAFTAVADGFMTGFQAFILSVSTPQVQVRQTGTGDVNGYQCRIYEVTGTASGEWVKSTVHIIGSGPYAGYATRTHWENAKGETMTTDVYDLGADFTINAPL